MLIVVKPSVKIFEIPFKTLIVGFKDRDRAISSLEGLKYNPLAFFSVVLFFMPTSQSMHSVLGWNIGGGLHTIKFVNKSSFH